MNTKYFGIALFSFSLALPFTAHADVIEEGSHPVVSCFTISNMSKYPDYSFFIIGSGPIPSAMKVEEGSCATFYKFDTGSIAAVSNEKLATLLGTNFSIGEGGTTWQADDAGGHGADTWALDNQKDLIFADQTLVPYAASVSDTNPLIQAQFVYEVVNLQNSSLEVKQVTVNYTNNSETTEKKDLSPWILFGVPVLGVGAMTLLFLKKNAK